MSIALGGRAAISGRGGRINQGRNIMSIEKKLRNLFFLSFAGLLAVTCGGEKDAAKSPPSETAIASETVVDSVEEPSVEPTNHAAIDPKIDAALGDDGSWILHGRTYAEERFSPLTQINAKNIGELELAWSYDLDTRRGQEATPIVVDGVMYTTSAWSKVQAFNARTGKLLWQYNPEVPGEWAVRGCCDVVNRGAAYWDGKIYVGTFDGRLVALEADSGDVVWKTDTIIDRDKFYTITGAPRIVKGRVLIGNGGGEFGVRGYVSAYDAETGDLHWRFFTVPGDPSKPFENPILEEAAKTWTGEWWKVGGGGTVWDSMAFDPELDLLYVGVGNGSPWNPDIRSPQGGDNLFLSSIVALRPDTGEYVWHYQQTPGDQWDFTATQHMILADIEIDGAKRKVLMQAPKNGFFYILDRETGVVISANNFVPVNWADGVDLETGRPKIKPEAYYNRSESGVFLGTPGFLGAHNWQPMSFNPDSGLVYIPAQTVTTPYIAPEGEYNLSHATINLGIDTAKATPPNDKDIKAQIRKSMTGMLIAWDPVEQKEVWRFEHDGAWNGGVLSTASGLVFQGNYRGGFAAYDAASGEKIWERDAQTGVIAAPISYEIDGEQYVAVVAGWGGIMPLLLGELTHTAEGPQVNRSRVLVYKLGGDAAPLEKYDVVRVKIRAPDPFGLPDQIDLGRKRYARYCAGCHGDGGVAGGVLPDLRWAYALSDTDTWNLIVRDGGLSATGMVSFSDELDAEELAAIRAYLVEQAHATGAVNEIDAPQ